ncbi:response regulator [Phaeovibrio sulfidiphilus]|uniref:Response regulator n=1 Tax=Phaeovibrio sulfidiphilus TaxID=1220600 RepID=A0A8J6Z0T3_9PROT|nr:response regulator [Phaeovibrio sulfidiphilus]MBE1237748.1 response regulator [Phaeovibrio sulfidiphilus]
MRLLLVEDDRLIGHGIEKTLARYGFSVDWFDTGTEGEEAALATDYDVVILDLGLPGVDGLSILKTWRSRGIQVPVLVLTARSELHQKVEGLDHGADDYLAKPFALEELLARLRALVRRSHGVAAPTLVHGRLSFDPAARQVRLGDEPLILSPREMALVEHFLLNPKVVISRASIEEKLYPWGEEVSSNAVEFHIHNIRKKLGAGFIRTVRGLGYSLGDPP